MGSSGLKLCGTHYYPTQLQGIGIPTAVSTCVTVVEELPDDKTCELRTGGKVVCSIASPMRPPRAAASLPSWMPQQNRWLLEQLKLNKRKLFGSSLDGGEKAVQTACNGCEYRFLVLNSCIKRRKMEETKTRSKNV